MPEFKVRYIKRSTGRANSATLSAFDEAHLKEILSENGEIAELLDVSVLPAPDATDRQLAYMTDLGVRPSRPLSIREASDLIDNAQSRRQPADHNDRMLAARYRIETTEFTSKAVIFQRILAKVSSDPVNLSRFFVYRVYRDALGDERAGAITDPNYPPLEEVAAALRADPSTMQSLQRQATTSTTAFRWFGDIAGRDGVLLKGDSAATAAFKAAVAGLSQNGLYSVKRRESSGRRSSSSRARREGQAERPHHRNSTPADSEPLPATSPSSRVSWIWCLIALGIITLIMW